MDDQTRLEIAAALDKLLSPKFNIAHVDINQMDSDYVTFEVGQQTGNTFLMRTGRDNDAWELYNDSSNGWDIVASA